jgi:hypothetical protein
MVQSAHKSKKSRSFGLWHIEAIYHTRRTFRNIRSFLTSIFTKTITIAKWQFNLFGVVMIFIGTVFGGYITLSNKFFKPSKALAESSHSIGQGQNTELTSGTGSNVTVTASSVTLGKDANWWDLSWNYKRALTIRNLSGATLNANTPVQVTINTASLESVRTDCNDLRIVYQNSTELSRSYVLATGATNCTNSPSTVITFPIQANLAAGVTDSTNYVIYYGNSSATQPVSIRERFIDFDGVDDRVTITENNAIDILNGSMTWMTWMKTTTTGTPMIYRKSDSGNANGVLMQFVTGGRMNFFLGASHALITTNSTLNTGQWVHLAFVYDRSQSKAFIYVNGVLDASGDVSNAPANMDPTTFGVLGSSYGSAFFQGSLDEFTIVNTALSQQNIQSSMNSPLTSASSFWSNVRAYWKFDETSGQTVTDSSGTGIIASLGTNSGVEATDPLFNRVSFANSVGTNQATYVCPFNETTTCVDSKTPSTSTGAIRYSGGRSAISFDGVDDHIVVSDPANGDLDLGTSDITYSVWFKTTRTGTNQTIIVKSTGSCPDSSLSINSSNTVTFNFRTDAGCTPNSVTSPLTYTDGNWHHAVGVFDRDQGLYLYMNGVLVASNTSFPMSPSFNHDTTTSLTIGRRNNAGSPTQFMGEVDEVAILKRTVTAQEVSSWYNGGTGRPIEPDSSTSLLYHFDENGSDPRLANAAIDSSGRGYHGTLTNGPIYRSGLAGVDRSASDTGRVPSQSFASHQGVFLEEATTNLVTNPSFETNATGTLGTNITATQSNEDAYFGSFSLKATASTGSIPGAVNTFLNLPSFTTAVSGTTYTYTAWYKLTSAGGGTWTVFPTGSCAIDQYPNLVADGVWRRVSITGAPGCNGTQYLRVYLSAGTLTSNATMYFDGVQIEQKSYATTYTDGSLGSGYAWTGTAHASTSTRTQSVISYPTAGNNLNVSRGSISLWAKPIHLPNNGAQTYFFSHTINGNRIYVGLSTSGGSGYFYVQLGDAVFTHASNQPITLNRWYHIVLNWDNGTANWYENGVMQDSGTYSGLTTLASSFFLGSYLGSSQFTTSILSDLRLYNSTLTAGEISSLYNSDFNLHTYSTSLQAKYPATGTWTSPIIDLANNGLWGVSPNFTTTQTLNGNSITFETRTSADSSTWTDYSAVSGTNGSYAINSQPNRFVQVRATLNSSNQSSTPSLNTMSMRYVEDAVVPQANASIIAMQRNASGSSVAANTWTNDLAPYFTWTAGADNSGGSGIKGYCVYLGTDQTGDPATTKGLLGTSPVSTSGTDCQFITNTTSLDFANTALRGSTWLTSSTQPYYLNIKAIDNTGNIFPTSETFVFRFDSTSPVNPSGLSAPQSLQRDMSAFTITWPVSGVNIATDSHSGVKGYQYRIGNSGTWNGANHSGNGSCDDVLTTGSYTIDPEHDSLAVGENIFYLRTIDTACNPSNSNVSVILKYSSDAPSSPLNAAVEPETNSKNLFAFTWEKPVTFNGSETGITFCYTINTLPTAESCTWTNATSLAEDAYATQPGKNTFYVVAKDEAGNVNYDDYASANFYANTSAPSLVQNLDIADVSVKDIKSWKLAVSWEAPSDIGAGIRSYKVYRSATAGAVCTNDFSKFAQVATTSGTSYVDTGLTQKTYYYCIKACDSANNCSAASKTVEKLPTGRYTEPAELIADPKAVGITTKRATITWTTDRLSDSKLSIGTKSGVYDKVEPGSSDQVTEHSLTLTNLAPGTTYYYKAKWTDEDGNTGISAERSFTMLPAPTVKDVVTKNISISSGSIQFTIKGAVKAKVYYGKTASFGGVKEILTSSLESTYTTELNGLEDNTKYYFKINAVDGEDAEYEGTTLSFTTIPRPRISNVKVQEVKGAAQPTVLVTWSSNTEISSIANYYPEGTRTLARDEINLQLTKEHKMYLKGLLVQSNYLLTIKGVDKVGNEAVSDEIKFNTSTDTRPATITNLKIEGSPVPAVARSGEQPTAQLVISWDTDEPTTSQVEFGEGSGSTYSSRSQEDGNLTYNHIVVISNLTPSKVYHLRVISKDKAGNVAYSSDTITITPKATQSALDLVIGNLTDIFKYFKF